MCKHLWLYITHKSGRHLGPLDLVFSLQVKEDVRSVKVWDRQQGSSVRSVMLRRPNALKDGLCIWDGQGCRSD